MCETRRMHALLSLQLRDRRDVRDICAYRGRGHFDVVIVTYDRYETKCD